MKMDEKHTLEERVRRLECMAKGECPECGRKTVEWKAPFGSFAPEMWATLREKGIDPATGHKQTCSEKHK